MGYATGMMRALFLPVALVVLTVSMAASMSRVRGRDCLPLARW